MGLRKNKSLLDQATETMSEYVDQVRPQVESAVAAAKDKAGPAIAEAKAKAGPAIAEGAALAAEKIALGASIAAEKAAEAAQAAADMVEEAATPEKKKGGVVKKLLIFTGLAAIAFVVVKKVTSGGESDNWQSSYTPTPAPRPTAVPDEAGGASPDEAISDQAEAPHPVTTPDDPAEVVDVTEEPKKK